MLTFLFLLSNIVSSQQQQFCVIPCYGSSEDNPFITAPVDTTTSLPPITTPFITTTTTTEPVCINQGRLEMVVGYKDGEFIFTSGTENGTNYFVIDIVSTSPWYWKFLNYRLYVGTEEPARGYNGDFWPYQGSIPDKPTSYTIEQAIPFDSGESVYWSLYVQGYYRDQRGQVIKPWMVTKGVYKWPNYATGGYYQQTVC